LDLGSTVAAFGATFLATVGTSVRALVGETRADIGSMLEAVEQERTRGEAELADKRAELVAMQRVELAQDSQIKLDVDGRHFSTSVETLRSKRGKMLA